MRRVLAVPCSLGNSTVGARSVPCAKDGAGVGVGCDRAPVALGLGVFGLEFTARGGKTGVLAGEKVKWVGLVTVLAAGGLFGRGVAGTDDRAVAL